MPDFIVSKFYQKMANVNLNAYGILDSSNKIHTLGTDSKILGRIFEMLVQPVLSEIATEHGLILKTPKSQTAYPDFVMMENEQSDKKIAIDVKSTYHKSDRSNIKFTLGSYGSYIRNNTKNIEYQYTDYAKHYVIGFVYKRNGAAQESQVFDYTEKANIEFPYYGVQYFIQEKYKIAGAKPGSGDTENIGSFPTKDFNDLKNGNGPFSELGVDIFDLYWKYYPKYRSTDKPYTTLVEFCDWFPSQTPVPELLHSYDHDAVLQKIAEYKQRHR